MIFSLKNTVATLTIGVSAIGLFSSSALAVPVYSEISITGNYVLNADSTGFDSISGVEVGGNTQGLFSGTAGKSIATAPYVVNFTGGTNFFTYAEPVATPPSAHPYNPELNLSGGAGAGTFTFSDGTYNYSIQINSIGSVTADDEGGLAFTGTSTASGTRFNSSTEADSFDWTLQTGTTFSATFAYYQLEPASVPDSGSTVALLGATVAGMAAARRKFFPAL
ncbi:MAG: hypothetical protein JWL90_1633 [Chthoniobacteraceae bacterium]|nr:hypothetical protein [Chthoniobacteraceae bacterium]